MQMIKYAFVMLSIGFVVFSCKKDDDKGPSKTELLTSATWKYDTVMIDANKDGKPDMAVPSGAINSCNFDNTITFNKDSTGILDEGANKCSGSAQTTSFQWWFKENETVLYSPNPIFGGYSGDAKVTVLTSTKLEVLKEITVPVLGSVNVVLDMKH
jgi:hypothetical protein